MGVLLAGAIIKAGASIYSAISANSQARKAEAEAARLNSQLRSLEKNRQDVLDTSSMIRDRSSMIQNEMANIGVTTKASEFQAEETDLSLANTLQTLRGSGFGSGGATTLAQMALRSKRDISADLARQERENMQFAAQGAQATQQARMAEAARVEAAKIGAAEKTWALQEARDVAKMDRLADQASMQQQYGLMFKNAQNEAIAGALGSIGGSLTAYGEQKQKTG
jgi:hypothetical protein